MATEKEIATGESKCPDCGRPLTLVPDRAGDWWYCPIAVEAQRRGLLGKPGRKHKDAWVYLRKDRQNGLLSRKPA